MSEQSESAVDQRVYLVAAYTLVSLATGIPAYVVYLEHTEMLFYTSGLPVWVYAAAGISALSAVCAYLTIAGRIHQPTKSEEQIIEKVVGNGE